MSLQALAQEIYEINKANGWHDGEPRSWAEICMLIESEIGGEAVEALRDPNHAVNEIWYREDGKPEGFVTEIADGVIRLLDGMVEHGIDQKLADHDLTELIADLPNDHGTLVSIIRWFSRQTHQIEYPYYTANDSIKTATIRECLLFITMGFTRIACLGHDPEKVIREKMEYNRTKRGHRHGGKRL